MRGDGSIFQRGDIWWMKFYRDGRPISMSCGTTSKDVAKTKLRAELRKTDEEFTEPRFKRVTIGELFKLYLDHLEANNKHDYHRACRGRWNNHLKPIFENMKAVKFDSQAQHTYRNTRIKAGDSTTTINREIQVLIGAFRYGASMEPPLVKRLPKFHLTKEENARRVFATPAQLVAIKKEIMNVAHYKETRVIEPLHIRTFFEIALMFGWRFMEVFRLKVENIHFAENTIRLEDSKNEDAREVPMTPAIRTLVEALVVGKKTTDPLFPFSHPLVYKIWNAITAAAGCPGLHIHDLRRTSARVKRAAGVDTSVIMEMQGWRSDAMFRRYGIVAKDDKVAALAKQEQYESSLSKGVN